MSHLDTALRVLGGGVVFAGGVIAAITEVMLTPLHWGSHALPVAPVLALLTGPLLGWYGKVATSHRLGPILPAVGWLLIVVTAATRTTNGYVLLPGTTMGIATLFCGMVGLMLGGVVAARRPKIDPNESFHQLGPPA